MKRLCNSVMVLMVIALIMTQCKKNDGKLMSNGQNETVTITLDVKKNNGSKVVVNPSTGTVNFESGDMIYVGSGGKYVGFLTHNGTNFIGNVSNPTEGQPLQFFFLGNVTPSEPLFVGTTETCSVIISDQTEHLPVISCAASNENYTPANSNYTAHLLNKCALVKFNVTTPSEMPVCITGMKNKVTLDFVNNILAPSMDGDGVIMLQPGSGENVEKWAILLPQEALEEGEDGSVYSEDGNYLGIRPTIPVITENGYLADGVGISVVTSTVPEGAINGLFTINENGDQVYFSQGNLQYIGNVSMPYWKFADNQWDFFGDNGQAGGGIHNNRDLFGWGTSGWDCGNTNFEPWKVIYIRIALGTSYYISDQGFLYGPQGNNNLSDEYANSDWGIYNPILNGGNQSNLWRTLTQEEWNFVFNLRNTPSGIRYAKAQVNDVDGVILLPDNWSSTIYQLYGNTNETWAEYSSNVIDVSQWNTLQDAGAVFLPVTGVRTNSAPNYQFITSSISALNEGYYWTADSYSNTAAFYIYFSNSNCSTNSRNSRGTGRSVRLVQDYNP